MIPRGDGGLCTVPDLDGFAFPVRWLRAGQVPRVESESPVGRGMLLSGISVVKAREQCQAQLAQGTVTATGPLNRMEETCGQRR